MSEGNLSLELKNKRICRFCMTQNEPLTNIYSIENRLKCSAPLPLQIMSCVSIEAFSNDGMPCTICDDCRMWMEHCYRFKQMCKKSDNLLRQYPLTGIWPQPLQIPKLSKEVILKMYPDFCQTKKIIASTQTDKDDKITVKTYNLPSPKPKSSKSAPVVINSNRQLLAAISHHKLAARQKQQKQPPRLLNKNSMKILNKIAQKSPEPILSQPRVTRDSAGNVEITTEILEQIPDEETDPTKNVAPVETNVFPCPHCERSFPLRQLLDIHMVNHNRERSFQCNICSKSFFSKYDLGKHMLIHTGEKPFECVVCKKAFTRSTLLHRHEKIHTDQPKYLCVYCEKAFLSKEEMDKHTERHRKHRPFVCKICNKAFAFKQGLERHETIHAKDQPYPCQYCDSSFSTSSKLARHLTAHAGERPFPCKLCPKSYLLSHHLTRHLRSHKQGSGSYKCFDCEKVFTTRDDLIYHSAVHATQTLICPLCKESFENLDLVTEHIRNHAEGEQYACEFCDLIFMTAEKLQNHSDTEHIDDLAVYEEHDKNVKKEVQQFTEDSQESTNNNDDIVEEFIIEEYHQEDDDQQQHAIDESNIKKENEVVVEKDIIYNTYENYDENTKQTFEEYNDEIGMEVESLTKDESEEFILEESSDESPPQKVIKLNPKENLKMAYNMETHKIREIASISSSNQQGRKVPEGKKQQQQQQQQQQPQQLKTYSSRQSATTNAAMKHIPKFAVFTKTIYSAPDKFKEMPSTSSSPLQEQESSNKRSINILNSMKILPLNKIEAKKPVINLQEKTIKKQQSEVNIKTEKNFKRNLSTNSNTTKNYSKISQNEKNNGNSSNASENKEKRSSDSSVLHDSSSASDNLKMFNNKNLVEMVIGDRKVKVQKIVMTKAQVELMTKEGKIQLKDGAMIIKNKNSDAISDSNNDNSSRKIITRSKQSISNKK